MFAEFYPLSLLSTLQRASYRKSISPPCGHLRKHSSGALLLQQIAHCERSSLWSRHPPIPARGQFLLWPLPDYCKIVLHSAALLYCGLANSFSVENVIITNNLLWASHGQAGYCVFGRIKPQIVMKWIKKLTLTLMLTLAELLTKILGHYTRAGAVTWVVGVVTWLIVVHLIGWVIWNNRGQSPQTGTVSCVVCQKA